MCRIGSGHSNTDLNPAGTPAQAPNVHRASCEISTAFCTKLRAIHFAFSSVHASVHKSCCHLHAPGIISIASVEGVSDLIVGDSKSLTVSQCPAGDNIARVVGNVVQACEN